MFLAACWLLATSDVAQLLERSLSPADLEQGGAALHAKVRRVASGLGVVDAKFRRVRQGEDVIVLDWRLAGSYWAQCPLIVYRDGDRVRVLDLPQSPDRRGWNSMEFRRFGNRIVGIGYYEGGTTVGPIAVGLSKSSIGWKVDALQSGDEISAISFKDQSAAVVVDHRDEGFKALTAPHAGPLLTRRTIWTFDGRKFHCTKPELLQNPLAQLDRLMLAARENNSKAIADIIPDPYLRQYFLARIGEIGTRCEAVFARGWPGEDSEVVGIDNGKGSGDWRTSLFFRFKKSGDAWVVAQIGRFYNFPPPSKSRKSLR